MKAANVKLFVRIRLANGDQVRVQPAYRNKTRTLLKRNVAIIDGKEEQHPEATYVIRYRGTDGKRHWEVIGTQPDAALAARDRKEREIQLRLDAAAIGETVNGTQEPANRIRLSEAIADYLKDIASVKARRTIQNRRKTLDYFQQSCSRVYLDEIGRRDLLDFRAWLYAKKLADRSVYNGFQAIITCLRAMGLTDIGILKTDWPRYTEKKASAYSEEELKKLFAAATPEQRFLFQFFVYSGGREAEVEYACYEDIDFDGCTFTVREKRDFGFKPKDREERTVPIPDALCAALEERKRQRPDDRLIFPTPAGQPDGHLLRVVKKVAHKAKLNCGHCTTRAGKSCADGPYCRKWFLHKLRKSFATLHHESGMSARTLQAWLGHSDLTTTLRYLESADIKSDRVRSAVNHTFAALA